MRKLQDDLNFELERIYRCDKLIDALLNNDLDACESEAISISLSDLKNVLCFLHYLVPVNHSAFYVCRSLIYFKSENKEV